MRERYPIPVGYTLSSTVLLASVVLFTSCRMPRIEENPSPAQPPPVQTNAVTAGYDLDTCMTNLAASLFADEDLVTTSASERRAKLQDEIRRLSKLKTLPNVTPEVRAEALYWSGVCYQKLGDNQSAYRMFKELAWEYPGSRWARFRFHPPVPLSGQESSTNRQSSAK